MMETKAVGYAPLTHPTDQRPSTEAAEFGFRQSIHSDEQGSQTSEDNEVQQVRTASVHPGNQAKQRYDRLAGPENAAYRIVLE